MNHVGVAHAFFDGGFRLVVHAQVVAGIDGHAHVVSPGGVYQTNQPVGAVHVQTVVFQRGVHAEGLRVVGQFLNGGDEGREVLLKLLGRVDSLGMLAGAGVVAHFLHAKEVRHVHVHLDALDFGAALGFGGLDDAGVEREHGQGQVDRLCLVANAAHVVVVDFSFRVQKRQTEGNQFEMGAIVRLRPVDDVEDVHLTGAQTLVQGVTADTEFHPRKPSF